MSWNAATKPSGLGLWPLREDPMKQLWHRARQQAAEDQGEGIDPLARLLDPSFTETLWEYEYSHVGTMLPGSLHPKQEEVLKARARHYWLFWGNQTGKTTLGAINWSLLALGRHPYWQRWEPGLTLWASALTWELWETILLPELLTWIPKDRILDAPEPFTKSHKRAIILRADNGKESRIEGKSAEQGRAKYQARRVHGVWMDEEHPKSIQDEVHMRLVRFGGITFNSMTPLKGFSYVWTDILQPHQKGQLDPEIYFVSHAGLNDNPGIAEHELEQVRERYKNSPAQLAARFDGKLVRPAGLALRVEEHHYEDLTLEECRRIVALGRAFAGIDLGDWRFTFVLRALDTSGVAHQIDEFFSQQEDSLPRAQRIHNMCSKYGCSAAMPIRADNAAPAEIRDLNARLIEIKSPYRIAAVAGEHKERIAAVTRMNDLLGRGKLKYRRGVMEGVTWRLGATTENAGQPVEGSRLQWEINQWRYPDAKEGVPQRQDPDDSTADGADAIAADRYAIMSYLGTPEEPQEEKDENRNVDTGLKSLMERLSGEMGNDFWKVAK